MLIQDTVTVWVLSILGVLALSSTLIFDTGWFSNRVRGFIYRSGEDISWNEINNLGLLGLNAVTVYGVPPLDDSSNVLKVHRHVRKHLLKVMKLYDVGGSVKTFSMYVLTVKGGSVRFRDYVNEWGYRPKPQNNVTVLTLDEVAQLASLNVDSDSVLSLCKAGVLFEQMVEFKSMPTDWVVKVLTNSEV